ncbi:MAG: response regulator [Balneolales bacterium]
MRCKHILLVEDDYLIGLNIQQTLTSAGFDVSGPAMNVAAGMELITENKLDAAVLDVNLGDQFSEEIVLRLMDLKIPYLLLTGYDRENLPDIFAGAPLMEKPFDGNELISTIQELCKQNR